MGDILKTIVALGQATGGSPELDRMIGMTVVRLPHMHGPIHVFARIDAALIPNFGCEPFPPYTRRLETAMGLIAVLFPRWDWRLEITRSSGRCWLRPRPEFSAADLPGGPTERRSFDATWESDDALRSAPIAVTKLMLDAVLGIGGEFKSEASD